MKRICGCFKVIKNLKEIERFRNIYIYGFILSTVFFAACSGKFGSIEQQDVATHIQQAEQAVEYAREANAPSLAFKEYEQAETYLEMAKEAQANKNGIDSITYANKAISHAVIAKRIAIQNTVNAEFNASILEKDALIKELRNNMTTHERKMRDLETNIHTHLETLTELNANIRTLENKNRELINEKSSHQEKVAELSETLKAIQVRVANSETDVRNYGNQVKDLKRKLDVADNIANSANKQKRAAIAESESLRKELRQQAKVYTDKLAEAAKKNIATEHAEYLRKVAAEARAYEKQLHSNEPKRTGRTSLSAEQINSGKTVLSSWENAWNSQNLDAHLGHYIPNISASKIVTRESKENQSNINRSEIESALREMNTQSWKKFDSDFEVEQESVIGSYKYRRLVSPAQTEDDTELYDMWFREIWVHQVQGKWKIYREIWQIYKNVPNYKE
ncbi:MAG: hypothetical protein OXD54_09610 [Candidatus Poribacteria bacterium]|nr:hypothetical protein [Candidatus Poribacteria bacterium]